MSLAAGVQQLVVPGAPKPLAGEPLLVELACGTTRGFLLEFLHNLSSGQLFGKIGVNFGSSLSPEIILIDLGC